MNASPAVQRVLLISIDGLRPDALAPDRTPNLWSLMERGASSLSARTVLPSITLPAHVSMFHSVAPEHHGLFSNIWQPLALQPLPGIMDLVRQAGRLPAAFITWEPLRDLARPGALAHSALVDIYGPYGAESDRRIAEQSAAYLVETNQQGYCPDFTFLYLGLTDEIGHRYGWMSSEYLDAVAGADQAAGHICKVLDEAGLLPGTACLVLSDHGGHENYHGTDLAEDMTIPWILAGPGVKQGCKLDGSIGILDTAPTLAHLLRLPIPAAWHGRVVMEALEDIG